MSIAKHTKSFFRNHDLLGNQAKSSQYQETWLPRRLPPDKAKLDGVFLTIKKCIVQ